MTRKKILTIASIFFFSVLVFFVSYNQIYFEKNNTKTIYDIKKSKFTYIKEYDLPNGSAPNGIVVDRDGFVWAVGSNSRLYKFNPVQSKIDSVYSIDNDNEKSAHMGWTIVEDNDGFIWFSQLGSSKPLWMFDPHTELFKPYSVSGTPFQMKLDEESGHIWFTTIGNTIGVIQKLEATDSSSIHKITEFELDKDILTSGLFLENGHVWISQVVGNKLIKFKILKDDNQVFGIDEVLQIPQDNKTRIYSPTDVFVQNNTVWFTEHGTSTISKYQLNEHQVKRFPTSANLLQTTTLPFWIKQSPNSSILWINEHTGNRLAFLNVTDLTLVEYEIPSRPVDVSVVYPLGISTDPQNKLWFSQWNTDKIGVIDAEKAIPFEITANVTNITIPRTFEGKSIIVDVNVFKKGNLLIDTISPISLFTSSSMDPSLRLVNVTATFTTEKIFLTEDNEQKVQLVINSHSAPLGNYTLAISATDGVVTKSVFVDLIIN